MAENNLQDSNVQDSNFVPGGADNQDQGGAQQDHQQEQPRRSVRDDLNDSFQQAREEQPQRQQRAPKARASKQPETQDRQPERRQETRPQAQQYRDDQTDSQTEKTERTTVGAPTAWDKAARSEWDNLSPAVQAAVAKRETDTQRGVEQLKAQYSEIDEALKPHMEAIRHNGFRPGEAVRDMFGWFNHLANNPLSAFHDLARSFGWDLNRLVAASFQQQEQEQAKQQQAQQEYEQIPPYMREALTQNYMLNQRLSQHEQAMASQNEARTHDVINNWSQDKPYFDEVRHTMGQLIASGAVPLKNGRVDLDGAYDMAVYALPPVRQKVLSQQAAQSSAARNAQQQQQRSAQQRQANTARARAASISSSAPGSANGKSTQVQPGTSVRDSLMAAIAEVGDHA